MNNNTINTTINYFKEMCREPNSRLLAKDFPVSNDTYKTGLNNNDLIVAVSGGGKTTSYVTPNIVNIDQSFVCADTKGNLIHILSPMLKEKGFDVYCLNLKEMTLSDGYNPLDYVRRNADGSPQEQDVLQIASMLCPQSKDAREPFWIQSAQAIISGVISLVLETMPKKDHNLVTVSRLAKQIGPIVRDRKGSVIHTPMVDMCDKFKAAYEKNHNSFAYRQFQSFTACVETVVTFGCIMQHVTSAIGSFDITEFSCVFNNNKRLIDLHKLGDKKTAVFINISDTSGEMYAIANLFYTQLFNTLCRVADNSPGYKLKMPVRVILDDFATNCYIPDFDKLISVIRSRELSVSIILQSLSQLKTLYTDAQAQTIINNCDNMVFFGTNDFETAYFLSQRLNVPLEKILEMPLEKAYIMQRGKKVVFADRILPTDYSLPDVTPATSKANGESNADYQVEIEEDDRFEDEYDEDDCFDDDNFDEDYEDDDAYEEIVDNNGNTLENFYSLTVPSKLVKPCFVNGRRLMRFCFASGWSSPNTPIYSSVCLSSNDVVRDGDNYRLDLGPAEVSYPLKTEGANAGYITAQQVHDTFCSNRERYERMLKSRNN